METAGAVVIGGVIHGTNIAVHLARRGLKEVILLEKTAIAAGASGKTGGLIGSRWRRCQAGSINSDRGGRRHRHESRDRHFFAESFDVSASILPLALYAHSHWQRAEE